MSATGTGAQTMSFVENYETEQPILELARFMHMRQQANKTLPSYQFLSSSRTRLVERGAGRMGEPTANLWEAFKKPASALPSHICRKKLQSAASRCSTVSASEK